MGYSLRRGCFGAFAWAIALLVVQVGCSSSGKPVVLTPKQINQDSKRSVVRVFVYGANKDQPERIGTGFVVSADGRIATNLHVIAEPTSGVRSDVRIALADDRTFPVTRIDAVDTAHDLVILGIDVGQLSPLSLGDSGVVAVGDPVVAIGHPVGRYYTVSDGLVSSIRHTEVSPGNTIKLIQISAPISVGSSGGPLFNERGRVIGVNTFVMREGQNLNFAIPSNELKKLLGERRSIPIAQFARRFGPRPAASSDKRRIGREVPSYAITDFSSCPDDSLFSVRAAIHQAIEVGAPLYNDGDHKACFKIYENTHKLLVDNSSLCQPVRHALTKGIERAAALKSDAEKAWALRDSFDGLLMLVQARMRAPQDSHAVED